ncbi:uncharacterized protein LOC123703382 [Colias croceus]|uniref:uncharacterized protein LOC123703382 n=1 Tax=Colias crocea TaxID=72248 RepID=UPI001E2819EA|nr:uncharacterized protein LOC123703382 [Colias croceus]XP_045507258.1 uncharacterized protein LOC123703382 [Colias croceus]
MRLFIILVLAVLSSASNLQIDKAKFNEALKANRNGANNRIIESIVLDLLEQIRELMRNGSGDIPVLDPLNVGSINVDENLIGIPGSFIELNNLTVSNLSDFDVDLGFVTEGIIFQRYTITLDAHIPEINLDTSSYDMYLKIFGGEVYGKGDMKLKIKMPRLHGVIKAALTTNNGISLILNECDLAIGLGSFEPEITGFWGSETSSAFISAFLKNLIPELLDFFENDINEFLSQTVLTVGNEILKDLDLIDLIRP